MLRLGKKLKELWEVQTFNIDNKTHYPTSKLVTLNNLDENENLLKEFLGGLLDV